MQSSEYIKTVRMKSLVDNGDLIDDFIGRIEPARDAFFSFYGDDGSMVFNGGYFKPDSPLIEFFITWLGNARRSYEFIGGTYHTALDWKLGFAPVIPYVFIAVADEFYVDPNRTLRYAERRADGTIVTVTCRPASLQPFIDPQSDRRPNPAWLKGEDRWSLGHIMLPDAVDTSTDY